MMVSALLASRRTRPDRRKASVVSPAPVRTTVVTPTTSSGEPNAADIEFIFSAEFEQPNAAERILAPPPASEPIEAVEPAADTPPYLARLYAIPLLTREQEFHLFRQMNYRKYRARRLLSQSRVTSAMRQQAAEELAAAHRIRNDIVEANLRLVVSIAKTIVDSANPIEDLISEGNVPLMRAVEIFDFTRGLRFSTYATWAIRHRLFRFAPRNRRETRRFVAGTETPFGSIADSRLTDSAPLDPGPLRAVLGHWLDELPERERTIVEARFGLASHAEPAKFREIAADQGLSTERVRQLLLRAVKKLRATTAAAGIELADVIAAS